MELLILYNGKEYEMSENSIETSEKVSQTNTLNI